MIRTFFVARRSRVTNCISPTRTEGATEHDFDMHGESSFASRGAEEMLAAEHEDPELHLLAAVGGHLCLSAARLSYLLIHFRPGADVGGKRKTSKGFRSKPWRLRPTF